MHIIDMPIGTTSAPLLADICLYSYGVEFIVFVLGGKEAISSFVQFHLQVLSINNQELCRPDASYWTLDQRHDRKQNFCFLPTSRLTPVDRHHASINIYMYRASSISIHVRGLSGKFADTANKTRNMYPRLKKFCINKYKLSSTYYT